MCLRWVCLEWRCALTDILQRRKEHSSTYRLMSSSDSDRTETPDDRIPRRRSSSTLRDRVTIARSTKPVENILPPFPEREYSSWDEVSSEVTKYEEQHHVLFRIRSSRLTTTHNRYACKLKFMCVDCMKTRITLPVLLYCSFWLVLVAASRTHPLCQPTSNTRSSTSSAPMGATRSRVAKVGVITHLDTADVRLSSAGL